MKMFEQLDRIYMILRGDSDLLKLLYYKSETFSDDPLLKPDVLTLPPEEKNPIINHRIKHTPVTDDLVDEQICRIIMYPGDRRSASGNYKLADQRVTVEVFVHRDYNDIDMRLAKICDRLNDLLNDKKLSSIGKSKMVSASPYQLSKQGYMVYRMEYEFGSGQ
jgi:hypothetical protein